MKISWLPTAAIFLVLLLWLGGHHGYAVLVGLLGALFYALEVAVYPNTKCSWCEGTGRQWSLLTSNFKICGHCGGAGVRPRLGHRIWKRSG